MTDPLIMCCGEAVTDRMILPDGSHADFAGGAAVNSAIALTRLGTAAGFLGALSTDPEGRALQSVLRREEVDLQCASYSDHPSTIATVSMTASGPVFGFRDDNSAGRTLDGTALKPVPPSVQALLFGGISLIAETSGSVFEALMARHAGTHLVYLDLNIRPTLIDRDQPYLARLKRMIAMADIIKVSDEDLEYIDPGPFAAAGALIVNTRGAQGVRAFHNGSAHWVPAAPCMVVDTLGAGDIFNAGVLSELHRLNALSGPALKSLSEQDLTQVLKFANHVAGISVTRAGADAPTRQELTCAP